MTCGRAEFEQQLRALGSRYHIHHPFNPHAQHGAAATPEQIRGWVANRFYYQISIPIKDAAILSNCPDREVRRMWVQRILDHDGFEMGQRDEGGIEAWLRLGEATGLEREQLWTCATCCPACASPSTPT
jgi:pyrroloquinoline-quinone synthase